MANNLFSNAREAVNRLTQNRQGSHGAGQKDMQAAKQAIQSAYSQSSPEEKQELQQLEQRLDREHQNLR